MGLYDKFKTNVSLETDGIWFPFSDTEICIKRAGQSNKEFTSKMKSVNRKIGEFKDLDESKAKEYLYPILAETIIAGWKNVKDENENELEFNIDNAKKILNDLPELANEILSIATNREYYLQSNIIEATKN